MSNRSKQCLAEQTVVCLYTCLGKVASYFTRGIIKINTVMGQSLSIRNK